MFIIFYLNLLINLLSKNTNKLLQYILFKYFLSLFFIEVFCCFLILSYSYTTLSLSICVKILPPLLRYFVPSFSLLGLIMSSTILVPKQGYPSSPDTRTR